MITVSVKEIIKKRLGQRVTFEATEENPEWMDNSIQFPRLLAEIGYVKLNMAQANALCDSMDLSYEDLTKLFNRADQEWTKIKRRYVKPVERAKRRKR